MESTCRDTRATGSIIKSGQKDTKESITTETFQLKVKRFKFFINLHHGNNPCSTKKSVNVARGTELDIKLIEQTLVALLLSCYLCTLQSAL